MKRAVILIAVVFMVSSLSFAGEEIGWWQQLKNKAQKIAPAKKPAATTAVGGVRGAQAVTGDPLYWKAGEEGAVVSEDEIEKFNLAVEHAMGGEGEESLKAFEEFLKDYPESQLAGDAKEAVERLKGE